MREGMKINRRDLLVGAGALAAAPQVSRAAAENTATDVWLKTCRGLMCEACNPPFDPSFDYKADRALKIATELNADSMGYPAASYYAYFPTKPGYPVHPELKGDPLLLADTGNKTKKLSIREELFPWRTSKHGSACPRAGK